MSLKNTVKAWAGEMDQGIGQARHGIVANVDPVRGLVKLKLDEEGTLTGWLPVAQAGAGAGWSMVAMPEAGAQAFMVPDMGDASHGVVVGFTHTTGAPPPDVPGYKGTDAGTPAQPGELLLVHKSGASIRLTGNGTIISRGMWLHDGDLKVSGQVSDLDGVHGTVNDLRTDYNGHHHTGVQSGGSKTGPTDMPTP